MARRDLWFDLSQERLPLRRRARGFTLIELLVVIAIIAVMGCSSIYQLVWLQMSVLG